MANRMKRPTVKMVIDPKMTAELIIRVPKGFFADFNRKTGRFVVTRYSQDWQTMKRQAGGRGWAVAPRSATAAL